MNPTVELDCKESPKLARLREVLRTSAEELSVFERGTTWKSVDAHAKKSVELLEPHSFPYFSVLRPLFLAQLRSAGLVDSLSPLLSRDGALSLAIFFRENPVPTSEDALLLVQDGLADLVPQAWESAVGFYRLESRPSPSGGVEIPRAYLILTPVGDRQMSRLAMRRKMEELRWSLSPGTPVEMMSCLGVYFDRTPEGFDRQGSFVFEAVSEARAVFGEDLHCTRWSESLNRAIPGSVFLDLNESDFYYGDSFLAHALLSQGARAFGFDDARAEDTRESMTVPASIHHSFRIFPERSAAAARRAHAFWTGWNRLAASPLIQAEEARFQESLHDSLKKDFKYSSPSFEDFVFARERG